MSFLTDQNLKNELKKIIGTNCEPTHELEKMLLDAYAKGRNDTLVSLGLDESEISSEQGLMAWTA